MVSNGLNSKGLDPIEGGLMKPRDTACYAQTPHKIRHTEPQGKEQNGPKMSAGGVN
jgi:hypothetical protein